MSGPLRATVRVLRWHLACWGQAISRDLQFRVQTLLIAVGTLADVAVSLVPALVLAEAAGAGRGGWDASAAVLVVGLFTVATAVLDTVVGPGLLRLDADVRTGELDLLLIRPIPAFLGMTIRWIRPAEATRVLTGAVMVAGVLATRDAPSVGAVAACAVLLALGVTAWALFWVNASLLSFWWASAAPVQDVVAGLREAGQYPRAAFGRLPRLAFSLVVPALLIAAVPAGTLLGGAMLPPILVGAGVVVAGALLTAAHWRVVIRRYDSASS